MTDKTTSVDQTVEALKADPAATSTQKAEALEHSMMVELDRKVVKSALFWYGEEKPEQPVPGDGVHFMQGPDPRLPVMPEKPTLTDFFARRFTGINHVLQSAALAQKAGHDEETILACLLHDISIAGYLRIDHGYYGAQLVAPYVSERVSWGIRYHQALRFYPDVAAGYEYPEAYVRFFGEGYQPEPYIAQAYEYARNHKYYMHARMITVNDIYAFDPTAEVSLEPFMDIIGRHFKQPEEGLGFDNSPVAHMWRTMIYPNNFL